MLAFQFYLPVSFALCLLIERISKYCDAKKMKKKNQQKSDNFQPKQQQQKTVKEIHRILAMMQNNTQRRGFTLFSFSSISFDIVCSRVLHFVSVAVHQRDASMSRFYLTHFDT